ncbi:MAG: hypothetical protein K6T55_00735 [Syntrophobacterales bacterium]|nr:hypothetical protein [Syntrophobacterales bacterium]
MVHRTFKTLEPKGEIAVAQRPEGVLKLMIFTGSVTHFEFTMDGQSAFDFAMEMLQHAYRLGVGSK